MNERIRELYGQAALVVFGYKVDAEGPNETLQNAINEKFAELIVKECAEQIKTHNISASSEDYGDYEIGFNAGLYHALYTIKQHFGVEE